MNSGQFCPECLNELAMISTTRDDHLWCTPRCDTRLGDDEALTYEQVQDEMVRRVKSWTEPHYYDFICPNCKSTQRVLLDLSLALGQRGDKCICLNCREELVIRIPYSAFTK
jgi:hypothetical protein